LGDRDVVGRPDYTCGGNDVADAIEGGGQEPVFLPHLDRDRGRSDLDFGDGLRVRDTGPRERGADQEAANDHSGANVSARKCPCQANLSRPLRTGAWRRGPGAAHLRGRIPAVSYRPRPPTTSVRRDRPMLEPTDFSESSWTGP